MPEQNDSRRILNWSKVPDWVKTVVAAVVVGVPIAALIEVALHNASLTTLQTTLIVSGAVLALVIIVTLWRLLGYAREIERRQSILSYQVNENTGILMKGQVRNVALRVDTINELVDALASLDGNTREERLIEAGKAVGKSWVEAFTKIRQKEKRAKSHEEQLELWTEYDATAGWGKFDFHLNSDGHGSVTLRNGFLSGETDRGCRELFLAGYLEATLERIYSTEISVSLDKHAVDDDDRSEFIVVGRAEAETSEQTADVGPDEVGDETLATPNVERDIVPIKDGTAG